MEPVGGEDTKRNFTHPKDRDAGQLRALMGRSNTRSSSGHSNLSIVRQRTLPTPLRTVESL